MVLSCKKYGEYLGFKIIYLGCEMSSECFFCVEEERKVELIKNWEEI